MLDDYDPADDGPTSTIDDMSSDIPDIVLRKIRAHEP